MAQIVSFYLDFQYTSNSSKMLNLFDSWLITDTEIPVIFGIPSTQNVNTDAGSAIAVVSWTPPIARDNSRKAVTLTSNYNPGSSFPIGTTTVTYTATDVYNNQAIASFDVIVTGKFGSGCFRLAQ